MHQERKIERVDSYVLGEILGQGTYGTCFKGYLETDKSQQVAIKIIKVDNKNNNIIQKLNDWQKTLKAIQLIDEKETDIIKKMNNPYIVKLNSYQEMIIDEDRYRCLIFEYCADGNLKQYLEKQEQKYLMELEALDYLKQIVEGYKELHKHKIIHHDIKPTHILLHKGVAKLSGFYKASNKMEDRRESLLEDFYSTFSCFGNNTYSILEVVEDPAYSIVDSFEYKAPQILKRLPYTAKCDVWSLGIVFYEMLYGKTPWQAETAEQLLENINTQPLEFPPIPEVSNKAKSLIKSMLKFSEFDRISWDDVFQNFSIKIFGGSQRKEFMDNILNPEDPENWFTKKVDKYIIKNQVIGNKGVDEVVYRGHLEDDVTHEVAVKVIKISTLQMSSRMVQQVQREIQILLKIKNPYIVNFETPARTYNYLYMFFEYCADGSLQNKLAEQCFIEEEAKNIIQQIVQGFKTLKSLNIVHRNIQPSNILFHQGVAKIADFGFARIMDKEIKDPKYLSSLGSHAYMAPQLLEGQSFTDKYDIWSVGIVFYEMLFGKTPWQAETADQLLENIKSQPLQFPQTPDVSNQVKQLISLMLKVQEEDRISWDQVFLEIGESQQ